MIIKCKLWKNENDSVGIMQVMYCKKHCING